MNTWTLLPDLERSPTQRDLAAEQKQYLIEAIGHELYEFLGEKRTPMEKTVFVSRYEPDYRIKTVRPSPWLPIALIAGMAALGVFIYFHFAG